MDTAVLEELGFTPAEIKVYIALIELGTVRAGPVVQHTRLQNSVVHLTLRKLVEKGLVSFSKRGKVRSYQASDPRNLLRLIDERRQRCEELLPALLAKQQESELQEAEVFDGMRGFKAMCYKLIEDALPGDEFLFFAFITEKGEHEEQIMKFYGEYRIDRLRRGIGLRGIAHRSLTPYFIKYGYDLETLAFVDIPMLQNVSICTNKVCFTPWDDQETSFLITSRQLADNFRRYFYSVWDKYRS